MLKLMSLGVVVGALALTGCGPLGPTDPPVGITEVEHERTAVKRHLPTTQPDTTRRVAVDE